MNYTRIPEDVVSCHGLGEMRQCDLCLRNMFSCGIYIVYNNDNIVYNNENSCRKNPKIIRSYSNLLSQLKKTYFALSNHKSETIQKDL